VLNPLQAVEYLDKVMTKISNISVVGIAGPGDPFANADETISTLRLVRGKYPDMLLCLASNGLEVSKYTEELAKVNISHVTITLNAIDPEIGSKIAAWVRYDRKVYRDLEAAKILLEKQIEAIKSLKAEGITVKINTVIIPGINEAHAVEVARKAKELGADIINFIPLYHVEGTEFEGILPPNHDMLAEIKKQAAGLLPQMNHCSRCRADAAGLIGEAMSAEAFKLLKEASLPKISKERPYVAVASMEGLFVNQHMGEAKAFWIFKMNNGAIELVNRRQAPPSGGGTDRWIALSESLLDCLAVLVSGIGDIPKTILENHGIKVITMEGMIAEASKAVLSGKEIPKIFLKTPGRCNAGSCSGTGGGC
jgi:nitrogen fixation protein NifB